MVKKTLGGPDCLPALGYELMDILEERKNFRNSIYKIEMCAI